MYNRSWWMKNWLWTGGTESRWVGDGYIDDIAHIGGSVSFHFTFFLQSGAGWRSRSGQRVLLFHHGTSSRRLPSSTTAGSLFLLFHHMTTDSIDCPQHLPSFMIYCRENLKTTTHRSGCVSSAVMWRQVSTTASLRARLVKLSSSAPFKVVK